MSKLTAQSSADRNEYGKLYDFVTEKKLRVKNIGGKLVSQVVLHNQLFCKTVISFDCGFVDILVFIFLDKCE